MQIQNIHWPIVKHEDCCNNVPAISLARFVGRGMLEVHCVYAHKMKTLCLQNFYKPTVLNSQELPFHKSHSKSGEKRICLSVCFFEPACFHFVNELLTWTFLNLFVSGKTPKDLLYLQNKKTELLSQPMVCYDIIYIKILNVLRELLLLKSSEIWWAGAFNNGFYAN